MLSPTHKFMSGTNTFKKVMKTLKMTPSVGVVTNKMQNNVGEIMLI